MNIPSAFTSLCALAGVAQLLLGMRLIERLVAAPAPVPAARPPVSVLKPLCGVDPLTELALESFFLVNYPDYQLVFGVQCETDPVLDVLARLRARYPERDVTVVVDATLHGSNRKISNLINMLPEAKHELLVVSDADIHVPVYFLDRVVAALEQPNVGLVTTLYTGLPGAPGLPALLGASQINYTFLPGALLARQLGRQDCLGVTMALSKAVLAEIGGLEAVANNLADDQVLGRLVLARGYEARLGPGGPGHHSAGGGFRVPVPARAALGPHHPGAGAGAICRLGPAILAVLGCAHRAVRRWRRLVLGAVPVRSGHPIRRLAQDRRGASPAENRRGVAFVVARFLFHHHLCREFHRQPS